MTGPAAIVNLNKIMLVAFNNATPTDGDLWFDGTDLKFRKGGVTNTVTLISADAEITFSLSAIARPLWQRTKGQTTANVTIAGTYTGTPSAIEGKILKVSDNSTVVDWATIVASPTGGAFSGTLTVPQGGPYYTQIRDSINTDITDSDATPFSVGAVVLGYGQSNWIGMTNVADSPPAASAGTFWFDDTTGWGAVPAANGIRNLLNSLVAQTSIPWGLVSGGAGGQVLDNLKQGSALYTEFANRITASGGDAEAIVFRHGESDQNDSYSYYAGGVDTGIYVPIAALVGRTKAQIPLIVGGLARVTNPINYTPAGWANMQRILVRMGNEIPDCIFSHSNMDATLLDGVHEAGVSYGHEGARFAQTILYSLGVAAHKPAWFISGATRTSETVTRVVLAHSMGTNFTTNSGIIDGFDVNGLTATGAYVDATTIDLTHASIAAGLNVLVHYHYGQGPANNTGMVFDNSALTVPLTHSMGQTLVAQGTGYDMPSGLKTGLLGWWKFDGDEIDASGSGHNGTLVNDPTYTAGKIGQALNFDGLDFRCVSGDGLPDAGTNGAITLGAWVKQSTNAGLRGIFVKGQGGVSYNYGMALNSGVLASVNTVDNWALGTDTVPVDTWAHIAIVCDATGARGYINGALVGSHASGGTRSSDIGTWQIGEIAPAVGLGPFAGLIDNVTLHSRSLSASEISDLYAFTGP